MRLTLRTLLAYLDDTLEPSQARAIGQKVGESESARELIERTKLVTRRRRLTTPPTTGPGSVIDPNTVAEYLDNEVTAEQAAEVEQICLSSDVHLAEVAACHQILTLILGEPVKPPVTATQRMYGLVKGPSALPGRKPGTGKAKAGTEPYAESKEIDETLRLGLPAMGIKGGWRNPLILAGGGFLAAVLLMVAIFQILKLPGNTETEAKTETVVQADRTGEVGRLAPTNGANTGPARGVLDKADAGQEETKSNADKKETIDKQISEIKDKKTDAKVPEAKEAVTVEVPFGAPNPRQAPIGQYVPDPKESSILLQLFPESKLQWKRLTGKQAEVMSAQPLLSLPGSRSVVQTNRGVRVTLWGNMPEFVSMPPIYESVVELYSQDILDLDILLQRGRVVLTSTRGDKPVKIRLRFEDPRMPGDQDILLRQKYFDIELPTKGASILVDRWSIYPPTEPFYKDAKNPLRQGPTALMGMVVLEGTVYFKTGNTTYTLKAPPGPTIMAWDSLQGPQGPLEADIRPAFTLDNPPLLPGIDPKVRKEMARARDNLAAQLERGYVDVVLFQEKSAADPSTRRLAVRSLAAISDLANLLDTLDQPILADMRVEATSALRAWIPAARDNDYKLFALLKEKYKNKEAEIIMELLHDFSEAERRRPERYELLIDYLVNPNLVIRELGAWRLYQLVPAGRSIPYSASADSQTRARAETLWRALIPAGQLPPAVAPVPKKK